MDSTLVRFTRQSPPYLAGETALFPAEHAIALVEAKLAIPAKEPARLGAGAEVPASGDAVVLVRFVKAFGPYNAGETAGFTPRMADDLVDRGLARLTTQAVTLPVHEPAEPEASVRVRFVKPVTPYSKDDVAAFPESEARNLVKRKLAQFVEEEPAGDPLPAFPASGDPDASTVDPNVQVLGLDDRKPDWREDQEADLKAPLGPPADKMVKRPPRAKKPGKR